MAIRFFAILFTLLSYSAYAQQSAEFKKLKTIHIIDSCSTEDLLQRYNDKGLLVEEVINRKTFEGSDNVIYKDEYTYEKGKTVNINHFCNDTLISQEITRYRGDDIVSYREIVKGRPRIDEAYSYHKGSLQKTTISMAGNIIVKDVRYDKTAQLKETTTTLNGTVTGIEKEYRNGNSKTVEFYSIPADSVAASIKHEYIFDDNNNIIDFKTFTYGKETERVVNRFDDANVMVSQKNFENGILINENLYDLNGTILKETNFKSKQTILYESKYNAHGHLLSVTVIKEGQPVCQKSYNTKYW